MYPFWEPFIEPLLHALAPETIVEVGAEQGKSTHRLLTYCAAHNAVLHAIDPAPRFATASWQREHPGRFCFHQGLSLEVLPTLEGYDLVMLDGDHNWYTVYHELKCIEACAARTGRSFPMVLLHDVGWPYGRRDLYYNLDTIPLAYRQPAARKGIRPGAPALVEQGGISPKLLHALAEGTPRNGVRTALEDFIQASPLDLDCVVIPGFHGLAVLFPEVLCQARPGVAARLAPWRLGASVEAYIERLERHRLALRMKHEASSRALHQTVARYRHLEARLAAKEAPDGS